MIGNSPKSDINPALAAGMNAVFVPTAIPGSSNTKSECRSADQKLLIVGRFAELREHF